MAKPFHILLDEHNDAFINTIKDIGLTLWI